MKLPTAILHYDQTTILCVCTRWGVPHSQLSNQDISSKENNHNCNYQVTSGTVWSAVVFPTCICVLLLRFPIVSVSNNISVQNNHGSKSPYFGIKTSPMKTMWGNNHLRNARSPYFYAMFVLMITAFLLSFYVAVSHIYPVPCILYTAYSSRFISK